MYCVNCGVELHKTAKKCVLCATPVINPNKLTEDEIEKYRRREDIGTITENQEIEEVAKPYGYTGTKERPPNYMLAGVLVMILITLSTTCFVINKMYTPTIMWSHIVVSSSGLLAIMMLYPMLVKAISGYIYTFGISLGIGTVLYSVAGLTEERAWLTELAMPILSIITIGIFIFIAIRRNFAIGIIPKTCIMLLLITAVQLCCDGLINEFLYGEATLEWSFIVATASISVVLLLMLVMLSRGLRNLFRKRFHL